jgi:hypothetical protein
LSHFYNFDFISPVILQKKNMRSDNAFLNFGWVMIFSFSLIAFACSNSNSPNNPETTPTPSKALVFDKLAGTWQSEDGKSFERWSKKEDGTFQSVAFSIKGSDPSWNENATIYTENNKWIFENKVKGQNDGKAVKFTSSLLNENTVQFSNPAHDFPTDVNYTVIDANTVHAFIIGPNNKGGKDTIPFNYTRVK